MHILAERHLLVSSDALATNTYNFSRNVSTERRREISRTRREIFVLSERSHVFGDILHVDLESDCHLTPWHHAN